MTSDRRPIPWPCFSAPLFLCVSEPYQTRTSPIRTNPQNVETFLHRATAKASIVILGGSSGVGKEAATYLESRSTPVNIVSRRTGYDFRNQMDAANALAGHRRAAISVGAGRGGSQTQDEMDVYRTIAHALSSAADLELAVVVLRALIVPEVQSLFRQSVKIPWVLIRPGPLVDKKQNPETPYSERALVTSDIRCNGLVSRAAVGKVIGDLLLGRVPVHQVEGQVFGVYDLDRMINHPRGIKVLGTDLWQ